MDKSSGMTRRGFLRRGAAAMAVAAAGPYISSVPARAAPGRTPPSGRITMGFIGVGTQGRGHLLGGAWTYLTGGYVARSDVQVLAVCDVWRDRREQATDRVNQYYAGAAGKGGYQACKAHVDFREVLARGDIDAVLIGTPIHWHALMSILAAKAGKDIYCEKPTAVTVREGRAMADAVRRYGRVYQAGTQQRSEYEGKFRQACELVRNGRIGKLKSVYSCINGGGFTWRPAFGEGKPVPDSLDWDLWLGPAPWTAYPGGTDAHRFGNGGINWGQHHFDIVQWGLDADRTGPAELAWDGGKTTCRYANGVEVHCARYPGEGIGGTGGAIFVGTEGRIVVDRENLAAYPASILQKPLGPDDARLPVNRGHSDDFLDCIRTRKATICDAETAHRAASLMIIAGIAEQLKRPLKWDPVGERFGDEEADRMLSAAARPPWQV